LRVLGADAGAEVASVTRARTVDGVRHGKRCACPLCDPEQKLLARIRDEQRAARRAAKLAPPLPMALDRPRRPLHVGPAFETEKTKRFRELLRAGVPGARAMEMIDADERVTT
jgi:hypothetical protein